MLFYEKYTIGGREQGGGLGATRPFIPGFPRIIIWHVQLIFKVLGN